MLRRVRSLLAIAVHPQARQEAADAPLTQEALLQKWNAGDEGVVAIAWNTFSDKFTERLVKRFRPLLSRDECEEVFCSALERAWEHRAEFARGKGCLEAWLWQITYHRTAEEIRQSWCKERRRETCLTPNEISRISAPWCADPDDDDVAGPDARPIELIKSAMALLTDAERLVLQADMNSDDGRASTAELSKELRVSKSAIRSYRARAKEKVRAELITDDTIDVYLACSTINLQVGQYSMLYCPSITIPMTICPCP